MTKMFEDNMVSLRIQNSILKKKIEDHREKQAIHESIHLRVLKLKLEGTKII